MANEYGPRTALVPAIIKYRGTDLVKPDIKFFFCAVLMIKFSVDDNAFYCHLRSETMAKDISKATNGCLIGFKGCFRRQSRASALYLRQSVQGVQNTIDAVEQLASANGLF